MRAKKFTILSVLIMAFIFFQSALPADLSSAESGVIVEWVMNTFRDIFRVLGISRELLVFLVRKGAHFTEYAILGWSLMAAAGEWMTGDRTGGSARAQITSDPATQDSERSATPASVAPAVKGSDNPATPATVAPAAKGSDNPATPATTSYGNIVTHDGRKIFLTAWVIGTLYAVSDELHQSFVSGRSCELRDMAIDSCGVAVGALVAWAIGAAIIRRKADQQARGSDPEKADQQARGSDPEKADQQARGSDPEKAVQQARGTDPDRDYLARLRRGDSLTVAELCSMVFRLSVPAILAQISTIIMQYIDASMVGRLGADGSAAIGLVSSSTWLFGGIAMAVGMGFTVQCAQRIGAGDEMEARNLMNQGMLLTLGVSILMGSAGALASGWLPVWLGGEPQICRAASGYFMVFALFFPVERMNYLGGSFLQSTGNMLLPGMLHVAMCVLDVIFNAFLIFPGFEMMGVSFPGAGLGVVGAALGTGLARLCSMCAMLFYLLARSPILHLRKGERVHFRGDQIWRSFRIALPVAVENIVMNSAQITSTRIVAPLGTVSVAANSLSVTAESLCYMPGYGIGTAATAIIGQSIGAGRFKTTRRIGWIITFLGMAVMTISGSLMYIFAPYMIGFLTPDPNVVALGTQCLRIEAFAEPMFAASIVAAGVLRGGGDTFVPAMICLGTMWLIRIPLALYLSPGIGLPGVWIAMCIELCVRGALFLARQAQGKYLGKV